MVWARGRIGSWMATALVVACAHAPEEAGSPPGESAWLAAKGFPDRAAWSVLVRLESYQVRGQEGSLLTRLGEHPDLVVRRRANGARSLYMADQPLTECPVRVLINGVETEAFSPARPFDFTAWVRSSPLSGLEIYPPHAGPVDDPEGCGTMLLWHYEARAELDSHFRGSVVGRASEAQDGGPVAGLAVLLTPGDHQTTSDARGRFQVRNLLPGTYRWRVQAPSGASAEGEVRLTAFAEAELTLQLEPSAADAPAQSGGS